MGLRFEKYGYYHVTNVGGYISWYQIGTLGQVGITPWSEQSSLIITQSLERESDSTISTNLSPTQPDDTYYTDNHDYSEEEPTKNSSGRSSNCNVSSGFFSFMLITAVSVFLLKSQKRKKWKSWTDLIPVDNF